MDLTSSEVEQVQGWVKGPCTYWARRFGRAPADVVEEVCSRVLFRLARRQEPLSSLRQYVTQSAWKDALRFCLEERERRERLRDYFNTYRPRDQEQADAFAQVVQTEQMERVEKVKAALTPRQLAAWEAVQAAGHRNQEVLHLARRWGRTPQAVYRLNDQARARIGRALRDREESAA